MKWYGLSEKQRIVDRLNSFCGTLSEKEVHLREWEEQHERLYGEHDNRASVQIVVQRHNRDVRAHEDHTQQVWDEHLIEKIREAPCIYDGSFS